MVVYFKVEIFNLLLFFIPLKRNSKFLTSCDYHLQMKLWKGNVFTSVCQSFCSRGGGVHPPGRHPPADPPSQTATATDGTHPTGIHSCLKMKMT